MKIEDYINRKALNERLEGDFKLFKELAQLFITDSPKLLSAVEEAVVNKNSERIGKTAHTIKGAIANFSAERAFNAALDLEKIGKNREFNKTEIAFKLLQEEIENMRKALKLLIEENSL